MRSTENYIYLLPREIKDQLSARDDRRTLVEHAAEALREEILGGRLVPGARVHLDEAATRLEMSPIPVREALRWLASEGLVIPLPQRGYRVREVTLADLEDTYRLRLVLDPLATRMAVPNLPADGLDRLATTFERLLAAYRQDDWAINRLHHRAFHFAIYGASGSSWLVRFIGMLWQNSERYQRMSARYRGTVEQRAQEHRRIMIACRRGDAQEAEKLMRQHLMLTYTTVKRLLDPAMEEAGQLNA